MTFTVDIHRHILPDFFWHATNEGDTPVGGIARRCNELSADERAAVLGETAVKLIPRLAALRSTP
jgi:hypothetical protein